MEFVYPAIFVKESGGTYSVSFPEIEGCVAYGRNYEDAVKNAEDSLQIALTLIAMENNGKIPESNPYESIYNFPEYDFENRYEIVMISCDIDF